MSGAPKMPKQNAEIEALNNFGAVLQRNLIPEEIDGYLDTETETRNWTVENDGSVVVRVIPTARADTLHRNDEFIDPYWNVEIVEDPHGLLAAMHPYSLWVYGPSIEVMNE